MKKNWSLLKKKRKKYLWLYSHIWNHSFSLCQWFDLSYVVILKTVQQLFWIPELLNNKLYAAALLVSNGACNPWLTRGIKVLSWGQPSYIWRRMLVAAKGKKQEIESTRKQYCPKDMHWHQGRVSCWRDLKKSISFIMECLHIAFNKYHGKKKRVRRETQ